MTCTFPSSLESFADFLVWPSTCDYYFYLKILGGLMIILAWILFKSEEKRTGEGDFIGALGTSSIAITVLGLIGTLITSTQGIPMIQLPILLYIVAVTVIAVLIWIFKD